MYRSNRTNILRTLPHLQLSSVLLCLLGTLAIPGFSTTAHHATFSGSAALDATKQAVSFGERPPGSEALGRLRTWIVSRLKPLGGQLTLDSFTAQTPVGPVAMSNIILKLPGTSGQALAITGHYDTARMPMVHFVGANDAGSSTGFLIEFARVAATMKHPDDIYVVFFDGEEALVNWTATDSLYGSRHLAAKWAADGTLSKLKALINIDMIGDKNLDLNDDAASSQSLRDSVWKIAARLGDAKYFRHDEGAIDDDHKPFVDSGVNAIDIIDLDYGPKNGYWHNAQDTLDKLSAHSFQVVGDVIFELVKELESS